MVTHILFLLDESGSMESAASDVRGGFNSYIDMLKQDGNDYLLSAFTFGSHVREICTNIPLEQAPKLTLENYCPAESTALYDALSYVFTHERKHFCTKDLPYGSDFVLCVIMTDGEENASRSSTKEMITAQIKRRQEAGNWTFVYLGTDQDAWRHAQPLGLHVGNVLQYTNATTNLTFSNLASSTTATNGTQTQNFFFTSKK